MKIAEEIKKEHDEIREYFLKMDEEEEKAPEIFRELAAFVLTHHESEENTVFSQLSNKKDVKELKNSLKAEHAGVRRTLQIILDTPDDDPMWKAHVHLAKDLLTHHTEEEEEELFKTIRDEKDEKEQEAMYQAFEAFFAKTEPEMKQQVQDRMVAKKDDYIPKTGKTK